ncbi:hypothetical protein RCL_jg26141.t1 [Rhizophagus clarus]|uniref:Uncharacterized protein n=1 Tax=Rhizophagus clarus TaxID=94130 RepID=A0A8H3KVF4_9GLOM|nr:hypothetical protein RCL_jg26141.t1 [Rhizophagus clarus]
MDNRANIKKVIRLWDGVERLTHTFQLTESDEESDKEDKKYNNDNITDIIKPEFKILRTINNIKTVGKQVTNLTKAFVVNPSIEALKFEFSDGELLTLRKLEQVTNDN